MRTRPIALTLLVLFATTEAPARAATPRSVTHEDQRDVMVTIYNGNLGLVKDLREARFPAGTTEVQFTEVAARIDPTDRKSTRLNSSHTVISYAVFCLKK